MITQDQIQKVKADFEARGQTFTQWAADNNFPEWAVYRVLGGFNKGVRGRSHEIAVKLGLKPNVSH